MDKNTIKKWSLIALGSFIGIIILLIILNSVVFRALYTGLEQGTSNEKPPFVLYHKILDENNFQEVYKADKRNAGLDYTKKNVLLFGSSYAYGTMLEDKDTFHYQLSQKLKRPVYNYALAGGAPQFTLMQIRSHSIDEVIKNSDYALLVTIGEDMWKLNSNSNGHPIEYTWPRYDVKDGHLVFHKTKHPLIETSYIYKYLRKYYYSKFLAESDTQIYHDYLFDTLKLHYLEIKKELEAINPNIKIIIIPYLDSHTYDWFIQTARWDELEEAGFIVVPVDKHLKNLRDEEYIVAKNDGHPSGKAWTEIIDLLVNKLKVIN